jgi:hypothetical protein
MTIDHNPSSLLLPYLLRTTILVAETSVNPAVADNHGRATESSTSQEVKLTFPMPSTAVQQYVSEVFKLPSNCKAARTSNMPQRWTRTFDHGVGHSCTHWYFRRGSYSTQSASRKAQIRSYR